MPSYGLCPVCGGKTNRACSPIGVVAASISVACSKVVASTTHSRADTSSREASMEILKPFSLPVASKPQHGWKILWTPKQEPMCLRTKSSSSSHRCISCPCHLCHHIKDDKALCLRLSQSGCSIVTYLQRKSNWIKSLQPPVTKQNKDRDARPKRDTIHM